MTERRITQVTIEEIHRIGVSKRLWRQAEITNLRDQGQLDDVIRALLFIHEEVSEATKILRECPEINLLAAFGHALADIVIATLDVAEALDIPIIGAIHHQITAKACLPLEPENRF